MAPKSEITPIPHKSTLFYAFHAKIWIIMDKFYRITFPAKSSAFEVNEDKVATLFFALRETDLLSNGKTLIGLIEPSKLVKLKSKSLLLYNLYLEKFFGIFETMCFIRQKF